MEGYLLGLIFSIQNKLHNEILSYIGTGIQNIELKDIDGVNNLVFTLISSTGSQIVNVPLKGVLTQEQKDSILELLEKIKIEDQKLLFNGKEILSEDILAESIDDLMKVPKLSIVTEYVDKTTKDFVKRREIKIVCDGIETEFLINHGLNTLNINPTIFLNNNQIFCNVFCVDENNIKLLFDIAPESEAILSCCIL